MIGRWTPTLPSRLLFNEKKRPEQNRADGSYRRRAGQRRGTSARTLPARTLRDAHGGAGRLPSATVPFVLFISFFFFLKPFPNFTFSTERSDFTKRGRHWASEPAELQELSLPPPAPLTGVPPAPSISAACTLHSTLISDPWLQPGQLGRSLD